MRWMILCTLMIEMIEKYIDPEETLYFHHVAGEPWVPGVQVGDCRWGRSPAHPGQHQLSVPPLCSGSGRGTSDQSGQCPAGNHRPACAVITSSVWCNCSQMFLSECAWNVFLVVSWSFLLSLCSQTLCALFRGVHQKNKSASGFDIINMLMGFDKAEQRMKVGEEWKRFSEGENWTGFFFCIH